jgi:hypothetical protein
MAWLKRNLSLVIFGIIALGLLGFATFYFLSNRGKNKQFDTDLEETKNRIDQLQRKNPFPSETNITLARTELARVRQMINAAQEFYAPIPFEKVADKDFRAVLDHTIFELQTRARDLGVELPDKDYAFSFKAQKTLFNYAPGSFPALPEQLAEIKTIAGVLFDAKVNRLANIKRMRVTVDDPAGSPDYFGDDRSTTTNDLTKTVSNPYEVTFHSFSGELAATLEGFYKSKHGMIVKTVTIQPVEAVMAQGGAGQPPGQNTARPNVLPGGQLPGVQPPGGQVPGVPAQPRAVQPGAKKPGAPEILKTILNEKLLSVTMFVEIIKPI